MYDIFMIDPPWSVQKGGERKVAPNQGRLLDYKTLSIDQIMYVLQNQIFTQANKDHNVFLWTVDKYLITSELKFENIGYKRHARFIWDKTNGVAPAFTVRYSHEYLIWFYKEHLVRPIDEMRGQYVTVFTEQSREHSRKPEFAYKMIESMFPDSKKMDVFTRIKRPNWDQFGDEIQHFGEEEVAANSLLGDLFGILK